MKIIAGGRGSGKTYELVHLAAADPEGYFVVEHYRDVKYFQMEYRGVIEPERIISRAMLANDGPTYRGMAHGAKNIYVDNMKSGEDIPELWMRYHYLMAVAVQGKETFKNVHLPDEYKAALLKHYGHTSLNT